MTGRQSCLRYLNRLDLDSFWIADTKFQQRGIVVEVEIQFRGWGVGGLALAVELGEGKDVERDGIFAEAELVQSSGEMEKAAFAAFVLANERVGDVQDDMVA